jgi:chitinase
MNRSPPLLDQAQKPESDRVVISWNNSCSEHGFCGTTELYCNSKCQSNCVLHPSPPGGAGEGVLSKVIGYYESWNAFSNCRKTAPTDLPLDALTHVNYAFAYIAPGSFQITTMDGRTPPSLFRETTNLKSLKPGLEVWVSVGGWTFSDNGTATQPLLGEISRDPSKRQIFANNLLHFLEENAFDGFDLDWEYPGAPDRGGKPDDPENFVKLMATIRQTLNRSPRKLGISFTIPASYWYLRWFKVPELLQYSDFTSLVCFVPSFVPSSGLYLTANEQMSYDLHGLWDKENPIGNVINPHTNLTEIQRAVELLWRVGVPPSKIALGFGFYGRSFRLADPSCTTPGVCQFSGDPNKGPCTDTSGYLSYYEIQDLIGPAASGSSASAVNKSSQVKSDPRLDLT